MTWAVARNPLTVALAVDLRNRSLRNIRMNPKVAIEVLGDDLCYGLRGTAVVEKELMESPAVSLRVGRGADRGDRDHGRRGPVHGPAVPFPTGKRAPPKAWKRAVYEELKVPAPTI